MSAINHVRLYKPIDWQARLGYQVYTKLKSGKPRCRASVSEPRVGSHQCNKPGHVEVDGVWLCRVHDPEAQSQRDAAARAKYNAEIEKRRHEWAGPRLAAALQQIADGHNDPRALAIEALGDLYRRSAAE